ncbi:MAG: 6-hydroxymethylpterin diphosphokinase MptE-like protein [Promethearchaeota archaeon]
MDVDQKSSLKRFEEALSRRKDREARFLAEWYPQILKSFDFDSNEDKKAAKLLSAKLNDVTSPNLSMLFDHIYKKPTLVAGAGPSLEDGLKQFFNTFNAQSITKIAADGAAKGFLDFGSVPDIVITDGDGLRLEELNLLIQGKSLLVIHAHGDNIPFLISLKEEILRHTIGSTQTASIPHLYNWGGFTDGDRAIILAEIMAAQEIFLVGMDFGPIIGRYSKPPYLQESIANESKKKKLQFAQAIISELMTTTKIPISPIIR